MTAPRVVVTGMGLVSPLGTGVAESWRRLVAGEQGFRPVSLFDTTGYRCRRAGEIPLPVAPRERRPRAARFLAAAAREAVAMAGFTAWDGLPLSFSTTAGGMEFGEDFLRGFLARRRPALAKIARYHPRQQLIDLERALGFRAGPTFLLANSCASGANSVGHALDLLQAGEADAVLAGGFEALNELVFAGFDCLQAATAEEIRPFDQHRSGLILGEGAAVLVLETEAHAVRRGAPALATLAGYGHATDTHHITQPAPTGAALTRALRDACARAGVAPASIDYVNAHGTGTPANDPAELAGYQAVFGPELPLIRSTKAAIGHTLGAAGAIEAVLAIQTLRTGEVPPQLGLREPLPGMETALRGPAKTPPRVVASANLGFGGSNAALVFTPP